MSLNSVFMNCAPASTCISQSMHLDLSVPSKISMFLISLLLVLSCLFCMTCVRICVRASVTFDAAGDICGYVGLMMSCCLGMLNIAGGCGSGCWLSMGGVAVGWYMLSLNAVLVPGGVFSVVGYLLQASVLWLLH